MAAFPVWRSINATCTNPPSEFHISLSQITVPEPYIYVTNITGNREILEHCTGSPVVNYTDNTMPADAIGCFLVAHVEKTSASEAWQCFMEKRLEGAWGVMEKYKSSGERRVIGRKYWVLMGLLSAAAVFGGL